MNGEVALTAFLTRFRHEMHLYVDRFSVAICAGVNPFRMPIKGHLLPEDRMCLWYECATLKARSPVVVEIGTYRGLSASILSYANRCAEIHTFDPLTGAGLGSWTPVLRREMQNSRRFAGHVKRNLDRYSKGNVTFHCQSSEDASRSWTRPVDLLFIDGNHEYEYVKSDFASWSPFITHDGVVIFHDAVDSEFPGPERVVKEAIASGEWALAAELGLCVVLRPPARA